MVPRGDVYLWFWCSWFWTNPLWTDAIHPISFTVKLTALVHCDQIDQTLLGCNSKKMYPILSEAAKSFSAGMELGSVSCLHGKSNETSGLLQFELDMTDVKKFGMDVNSDQVFLDYVSSELAYPLCSFQSIDVQYPVERRKYRIRIEAYMQKNCRKMNWHSDLLSPQSQLFRSYEDTVEKQIRSLLEELNYLRFVDDITVAYFYSENNHTIVFLLMDLDEQHVSQKFLAIHSISQSISTRLKKQNGCVGISLLFKNIGSKFHAILIDHC
ncbi:hypothetical protein FGIG_00571 [Fasciola gigantica]|uniref:Uncharacterized protein n=1 Tax=Fasciola gigantica TaxID=46835 RepID=A0A504YA49_FASGI|nr:hypothetical protein FGIG_00571 [Fasciola gigantica]